MPLENYDFNQDPFPRRGKIVLNARTLSSYQKLWLGHQIVENLMTWTEMFDRFEIPRRTVELYCTKYRNQEMIGEKCGGRPSGISESEVQRLQNVIQCKVDALGELGKKSKKSNKQNCIDHDVWIQEINISADNTRESDGRVPLGRKLCGTTVAKYKRAVNASITYTAQQTTNARDMSEFDFRNWLAEAATLEAFQKDCPAQTIVNIDATTYKQGPDGTLHKCVMIKDKNGLPTHRAVGEEEGLGNYVKVYNQISAAGCAAPLVILLADKVNVFIVLSELKLEIMNFLWERI